MTDPMPVTLHGTHLGDLVASSGGASFVWSEDAERRWPLNSSVLSRNLPVGVSTVDRTESFFGRRIR